MQAVRDLSHSQMAIRVLTVGHSTRSLDLDELLALAGQRQIAIRCAEAVPWRCQRSLIADALLARRAGRRCPERHAPHAARPDTVRAGRGHAHHLPSGREVPEQGTSILQPDAES
jgi:uncharacterized protein DUF488